MPLPISKGCPVTIGGNLNNYAIMKELDDLYKPLWASNAFKNIPMYLPIDNVKGFCQIDEYRIERHAICLRNCYIRQRALFWLLNVLILSLLPWTFKSLNNASYTLHGVSIRS